MQRGKKDEQKQEAKTVRSKQKNTGSTKTKGKTVKKRKTQAAAVNEAKNRCCANERNKRTTSSKTDSIPKRLREWLEPEKVILLEGWARDGLSMEQIAHNMGIAKDTLYRWLKISSDISDAIKKGKEVTDYLVENALFASALQGNVVAQIFWLKNRKPDRWKDKVEQVIDTEADTAGVVLLAPVLEKNHEPTEESDMGTTTETN